MGFKDFRVAVIFRVFVLTTTIFLITHLLYNKGFLITVLLLVILMGLQVISLVKFVNRNNESVVLFLNSIKNEDLNLYYTESHDPSVNELNEAFNNVLKKLKKARKEQEADFQYLKNIVQHVGIGLITFNAEGNVQIINTAAKKLLKISQISNIHELRHLNEPLVDMFVRLRTGGRDLIRLEIGGDIVQLAVYAIELNLRGELFKLVSIQNIQSELEEKEMEAWQNLVRVLTHEIMNSVTPISSLAATVDDGLKSHLEEGPTKHAPVYDLQDLHLAVQTIQKRSVGLIRFVQDFRNLTHIPKPKIKLINIKETLEQIEILLQKDIKDNHIRFGLSVVPEDLKIDADKELIEQVLINLVKNAIQAFDEQTQKIVSLKAYKNEKGRPIISVEDNGNGIDEEALEKIFIPFFTTKKNGSGIGLSLSRQIMRQHQGALSVKTKIDEGTTFFLKF